MLPGKSEIEIPREELDVTFARSSGPGGQNVNKVNSKVLMRWSPATSGSLPEAVRTRFLSKFASRLTATGDLVLTSQKYRDQHRNIDDCLSKLDQMIAAVALPPTPRRPTKPTRATLRRRAEAKSAQSNKKEQRRQPQIET